MEEVNLHGLLAESSSLRQRDLAKVPEPCLETLVQLFEELHPKARQEHAWERTRGGALVHAVAIDEHNQQWNSPPCFVLHRASNNHLARYHLKVGSHHLHLESYLLHEAYHDQVKIGSGRGFQSCVLPYCRKGKNTASALSALSKRLREKFFLVKFKVGGRSTRGPATTPV